MPWAMGRTRSRPVLTGCLGGPSAADTSMMGVQGWNRSLNEANEARPVLTGLLAGLAMLPVLALIAWFFGLGDGPLVAALGGSVLVAVGTIIGGSIRRYLKDEQAAVDRCRERRGKGS